MAATSTSDPLLQPPAAGVSLVDIQSLVRGLRKRVTAEAEPANLMGVLTQLVSTCYTLLPRSEAWHEADAALSDFYPSGPPPVSSYYRYIITLPACYTGWDRERCQRLCAAVSQAYRATYPTSS